MSRERALSCCLMVPASLRLSPGTSKRQAVPLPVNPLLPAHDIVVTATKADARLFLASVEQIQTLTELGTKPPILIDGPTKTLGSCAAIVPH